MTEEKTITQEENEEKRIRMKEADRYLKGYGLNKKLLRMDRYEREFFGKRSEEENELFGEGALARARMFEIRHFIMELENCDEKLLLYYHYIKGEPVERCGELLGVSRSSAFRMKQRALWMAAQRRWARVDGEKVGASSHKNYDFSLQK